MQTREVTRKMVYDDNQGEIDFETLRKRLLDEAYAGAFSGLGAMILDVSEIENAWTRQYLHLQKGSE